MVAGVFAAAISSLDSILAALSQATLAAFLPNRTSVRGSRVLVVVFGILLCALAVLLDAAAARYESILDLALALAGYTVGALLAGFVLAFLRPGGAGSGYPWSAPLAVLTVFAVAWHEPWSFWTCFVAAAAILALWMLRRGRDAWKTVALAAALTGVCLLSATEGVVIAFPWFGLIGFAVALGFGILLGRGKLRG